MIWASQGATAIAPDVDGRECMVKGMLTVMSQEKSEMRLLHFPSSLKHLNAPNLRSPHKA